MDLVADIKGLNQKEKKMGKEDSTIKTAGSMTGIGLIIKCKDMENCILQLASFLMKDIG